MEVCEDSVIKYREPEKCSISFSPKGLDRTQATKRLLIGEVRLWRLKVKYRMLKSGVQFTLFIHSVK
jgi:hypothetical protein